MPRILPLAALLAPLLCLGALPLAAQRPPAASPRTARPSPPAASGATNRVLAVVNGEVVTQGEVTSRARLFAMNTGVGNSPEVVERLRPQVLRLVIDEKLRMQEVQRRRIPVSDNDIAEALSDIERRNNLPSGALRAQLRTAGIQPRVLYDQIRAQIGWGRMLRQMLGPLAEISEQDVQGAIANHRARQGQTEYLIGEIFIPVDDPSTQGEVSRFVEEVVGQLRRGSPFAVVATQFSQAQTALQGGDLGWVTTGQLDPEVASVVDRMPQGAVSNPIRVAGGFQIITLRGKREGGRIENSTMLSVRQVFLAFTSRLDPQAPTEAHRATLERAQRLASTLRSCEQMEAQPRTSDRPSDPGPIRLETLNPPALRQLLATLPIGRPSQPVISPDGILILMVCSREQARQEEFTPDAARQQILRDRVEVLARQLQRELRRRAVIETRS
jgi:peptidyl-prolyl cis-trans isomerase SurA